VILCDFLSMYPTVCILMRLWRFVIAEGMSWRDTTAETRARVDGLDLAALRLPQTWQNLATLVRIKPEADIFPVRADYTGTGDTTIGVNYLTGDTPQWFALADCIASMVLTGKTPEIVEAITFKPEPIQSGLKSIEIGGAPVDPITEDFYARVIALRQQTKAAMKDAIVEADRKRLDVDQFSLKICANSTSYGIFLEINVEEGDTASYVTVHNGIGDPYETRTAKCEKPGPFFHPLLGTLITGAARLMLAITERLVADEGLEWAFCDTDSMAIAKSEGITIAQFHDRVGRIVDWFAPLNPHGKGSILQIEEVNTVRDADTPLFVWAISAKRYALFNLGDEGRPIIRKASGHGLGHLTAPYDAGNPASNVPAPQADLDKIGVPLWQHDVWWRIVSATIDGHPNRVVLDHHPSFTAAALSRYSATSPHLERWFKCYNDGRPYRDRVRPFNFLTSLSVNTLPGASSLAIPRKGRPRKHRPIKPIAPFSRNPDVAGASAFDRDTGEPIASDQLRSYASALVQYHIHPENKFQNGDYIDHGPTERRHVRAIGVQNIGKESTDWEGQMYLSLEGSPVPDYGSLPGEDIAPITRTLALRQITKLARRAQLHRLSEAIERDGLRHTARRLDVDPSNLRRKLKGDS
jgi:hypothetical protein